MQRHSLKDWMILTNKKNPTALANLATSKRPVFHKRLIKDIDKNTTQYSFQIMTYDRKGFGTMYDIEVKISGDGWTATMERTGPLKDKEDFGFLTSGEAALIKAFILNKRVLQLS